MLNKFTTNIRLVRAFSQIPKKKFDFEEFTRERMKEQAKKRSEKKQKEFFQQGGYFGKQQRQNTQRNRQVDREGKTIGMPQ